MTETPLIPKGQPVITALGRYVAVPQGSAVALSCRECGMTYHGTSEATHAALRDHWVGTHPMPTRPPEWRPPARPRRTGRRKHYPYVPRWTPVPASCQQCGEEFIKSLPGKAFCTERCRRRHRTDRDRIIRHAAIATVVVHCPGCDEDFTPARRGQGHCSAECYRAARRTA